MSKWRDPKLKGWTPKNVGVGAGFMDDPFGSVLNALLTPVGADQPFTSTFPSISQQPLEAAGAGLMAGMVDLPANIVKWGEGAVIGGMQAAGEALGANPSGQPIDVRSRIPQTSLQPLQQVAQRMAGPGPAGDLAAKIIPDRLDQLFNALDTANRPKTLPSPTLGNVLDPQTARARFSAVAPPTLELATDVLAGFKGPQLAGKVLGKAGPPLRTALKLDEFAPVVSRNRLLGQLAGQEDLPTAIKDWLQTPAGTKARAALTLGPPLIGAAGMGLTTQATDQEPVGSAVWFQHAGQRAVTGSLLGFATTMLGVGALRLATAGALNGTTRIAAATGPEARAYLEGRNQAAVVAGRDGLNPSNYPGQWFGYVVNGIKDAFTDALAGVKAAERTAVVRIESGKALAAADVELPRAQAALSEHTTLTMPSIEQAHNAAELDVARKTQAVRDALVAKQAAADPVAKAVATVAHAHAEKQLDAANDAVKVARRTWTDADRVRQALETRAGALQEAVDRGQGAVPVPHEDLFGRLSQALNGLDGEKAAMREGFRRDLYSRVKKETVRTRLGPVERQYGIAGKVDFKTYNDWRPAFAMRIRALDGHMSVAKAASGTTPAKYIRTVEEAQAQYDEVLQTLKIDAATESRYINTVRKETEKSNRYIQTLHEDGFLTAQDAQNILEQPFYLRANVLSDIVRDWNETQAIKAQKLFAGSKGVEEQHAADQVFSATTTDLTDRNALLIQLIQQNRIMKAAVRTGAADPMGFGTLIQKLAPEADAALHSFATRADEVYGDLLRVQREKQTLLRQTTGDLVRGRGPLDSAVNRHTRLLAKAEADLANTPFQGAAKTKVQARVNKWRTELAASQAKLNTARTRLAELNEQEPLLKIQRGQLEMQAKNRASAAPQEAWRRSIQVKRNRAIEFRGNADDLTHEATVARTPKRQQELLEQATKKRAAAARQDELADKLEASGMPEPLATALLPAGMRGVPVYENGAAQIYTVPDWFHQYLIGANTPQVDVFTRFMSSVFGKFWRGAVTTYSVSFAIRNAPRDLQTALVNYAGAGDVPAFLGHYARAWADVIGTVGGRGLEDVFSALARHDVAGKGEKFGSWADELNRLITLKSDTERFSKGGGALGTFVESQGGGITIGTPLDFLRKTSLMFEMPARVAVFKSEIAAGATVGKAAYAGRTMLTDFSKAGSVGRILNMWAPLVNARWQGQLQTWDSFRDNPQSFLGRATAAVAMPYITSYVWNRTQFGDLLDQIPPDVLSRNGVVIYAKWFNDKTQREEPLYFKIPLSEVGQGLSVPLRYLLDQQYHQETQQGTPLDPAHRSVWSPQGALRQVVSGLLPNNPQPSELDPMGLVMASVTMNPGAAAGIGVMTNWDRFRGRPVADPEEAALWDQYRWAPPDTSALAQVATELLSEFGMKTGHLAPTQVDFVLKSLGGSLMQKPTALASDALLRDVWRAWKGNQPLPSERTLTPSDLQDAPTSFAKYVNANKLPDNRPALMQNLGFLFGAGGAAQSITERVKQDDPRSYDAWMATRKYQDETTEWDQAVYRPKLQEIYAHKDWSFAKINDEVTTLGKQRQAVRARIASENNAGQPGGAIIDPTARRAFLDKVPGVSIDPEGSAGLMSLPPGVDLEQLEQRFMQPPGVSDGAFAGMNPQLQQDYRQRELDTMARELSQQYHTPISPDTIGRAISAKQRGLTVPALPLPETYVDDWVSAWRSPEGYNVGDPPELLRAERAKELDKIILRDHVVEEMSHAGILDPTKDPHDQARQAVMETINTRMLPPGDVIDLDVSRDKAYALSAWVRDDTEFPLFVDQNGEALGTPQERANWSQQLASAQQNQPDKRRWPAELRLLDRYKSYADVLKTNELYNHPDYLDYSRWFGVGRTMTQDQWAAFQSGEVPKYTKNGKPDGPPIPPGAALQFDHMAALYRALPDGPQKNALQWKIKRLHDMAVPNWKLALDTSELNGQQQSLQDELIRIDTERAAIQAQNEQAYANVVALG